MSHSDVVAMDLEVLVMTNTQVSRGLRYGPAAIDRLADKARERLMRSSTMTDMRRFFVWRTIDKLVKKLKESYQIMAMRRRLVRAGVRDLRANLTLEELRAFCRVLKTLEVTGQLA